MMHRRGSGNFKGKMVKKPEPEPEQSYGVDCYKDVFGDLGFLGKRGKS